MIQRARGFTLVEMLLALAILAALSVAAVTVLQNVMRADTLTRDKGGRMQALQLTFSQMAADFSEPLFCRTFSARQRRLGDRL